MNEVRMIMFKLRYFFLFLIIIALFQPIIKSQEIPVDSDASPIKEYFTEKKIFWTFDDYFIGGSHHPPHKGFYGLSKKISDYGGHVNIMVVFTPYCSDYKLRNYSVLEDFGWSQPIINKSLKFFQLENIHPQCHGWDHCRDLNLANLSFAQKIINYTFWNWLNNFNIKPNFFLGHGTSGNYNITLALKQFSQKYWPVYGEMFRVNDENLFPNKNSAVDYIQWSFDPAFGIKEENPCKTVDEAIKKFQKYFDKNELIFIRGHPMSLNGTDNSSMENLTKWENFIDYLYQNYNLININHFEAVKYKTDRHHFRINKEENELFITYEIDLRGCKYNHNINVNDPCGLENNTWTLYQDDERIIEFEGNSTINFEAGFLYQMKTENNNFVKKSDDNVINNYLNYIIYSSISVIIFISIIKKFLI